jgi:hypothetical protein
MPLRFTERTELKANTPLTELQGARLAAVGPLYFGGAGGAQLAGDDFDDDPMASRTLMFCFEWKIVDGPEHVYDAWLYMTDSGTFFKAGTADRVAEVIQFGLQCGDLKLRAELGPAMVEAHLLPQADGSYQQFAKLLAEQQGTPTISAPTIEKARPKKALPKKALPKQKTAKKKTAKKQTAKKAVARKKTAQKAVARKRATKKPVAKNSAKKKAGTKKARSR